MHNSNLIYVYFQAQEYTNGSVLLKIGTTGLPIQRREEISNEIDKFSRNYPVDRVPKEYYDKIKTGCKAGVVEYLLHSLRRYNYSIQDFVDNSLKETTEWCFVSDDFFVNVFLPLWEEVREKFEDEGEKEFNDYSYDDEFNDYSYDA